MCASWTQGSPFGWTSLNLLCGCAQALLSLCSGEIVAAKAAVDLCIAQVKKLLSAEQLPLDATSEAKERAFHATEAFVQVLTVKHV